jgi:uncharacterized membrane protein YgcG
MKLNRKLWAALILALFASTVLPVTVRAQADNVNDFSIRSFEADYYLTRDEARRSRMKVVEKIVAEFPGFDQNHGLERAIPEKYDGHKVSLEVESVKKDNGQDWDYTTYGSNDNKVLRIGDADKHVHGVQTYVIEYTLRDVTKNFRDHDELYWDVNGTGWKQPFGSVTARLHMDGAVAAAFDNRTRCFMGIADSTHPCRAAVGGQGDEAVITFSADRTLYAGENITFVAGFEPGSFAPHEPTAWERLLPVVIIGWLAVGGLVLLVTIGVLVHATRRYGRSPKGKGTIVPEYLPPKDMHVLLAANILNKNNHAVTAQLIDLAVRHHIKIYEADTRGNWFRKKRTYELELTKGTNTLTHEERQLVHIIFGQEAAVGQRVTIELLRAKLYKQSAALLKEVKHKAETAGYFADRAHQRRRFHWVGGILVAAGILLLLPGALIAGIVTLIVASSWRPFTQKGVEQRDYLKGLRMYMKLAEAERLKQLQSPEGAARGAAVDPGDKKQLVKLYERLLPYAILFGMEKEWVKELAPLYEQSPGWYSGSWGAFHGAAFAASLNSFTNASNSAFSPPASSSSSGFSGGGSSGGGGGGGGGGGW